ncbi:NAD-dependent epimerase/dehydratase family protein [Kribbella pratensis]|uniref:NAD-dependent epimerase/dehydratase family protein n=1 Tax=Kribbella pratensis TaxID=2512112 RepID=A0ABY2FAF3_9ACTN|nr:NAD(P)-dependent oxidoreductase [Kribbella pratensis]TDW87576.1 NAD-dependent epimerase/dehydratase family protein [Kribbella pratensis]
MRIFIAGATGAIGRRLVPLLVAQGHHVTALTRRPHPEPDGSGGRLAGGTTAADGIGESSGRLGGGGSSVRGIGGSSERLGGGTTAADGIGGSSGRLDGGTAVGGSGGATVGGVTTVVGDVYDAERLREVIAEARPDVVMHQLTDLASRDFAANSRIRREGTRNLVDAALAAGVRRVVSQSIAWAYEPGSTPATESTPLDLHAPDATRRATVEAVATLEAITAEAPEWVVLRYGMLYGPDTWYTKGALMADLASTGNLPAGPDITSFLHVDDAATAATAALTWPTGPVNIVDNDPAPASTWTPAFAQSVGAPPPKTTTSSNATASRPTTPAAPTGAAATSDPTASDAPDEAGAAAGGPTSDPTAGDAPGEPGVARTPWARGASNAYARSLGWSPAHPTWRTGFTS